MEWLLAGLLGQVVALRALAWLLAWEPGHLRRVWRRPDRLVDEAARSTRRGVLVGALVALFALATAVALMGLVLAVRSALGA